MGYEGDTNEGYQDYRTDKSPPTQKEGRLFYDNARKSMAYGSDLTGITPRPPFEGLIRVINTTGSTILKGKPVYVNGYDAGSGLPTIALAKADALPTAGVIGLVLADVANNAQGIVCNFGPVTDVDTSAFAAGDALYLSAATAGLLTTTAPSPYAVFCAVVIKSHATTGILLSLPAKFFAQSAAYEDLIFGDGADGDDSLGTFTFSGLTVMRYENLTIQSGATIDCTGDILCIFVRDTLTIEGSATLLASAVGGSGGNGGNTAACQGGAGGGGGIGGGGLIIRARKLNATATATLTMTANGANGANGSNGTAPNSQTAGQNGSAGTSGQFFGQPVVTGGGGGGGGGATGAAGAGGAADPSALSTFAFADPRGWYEGGSQRGSDAGWFGGGFFGSGGGGGGQGGENNAIITTNAGGGGGGGAGGGNGNNVSGGGGGAGGVAIGFTGSGGGGGAGGGAGGTNVFATERGNVGSALTITQEANGGNGGNGGNGTSANSGRGGGGGAGNGGINVYAGPTGITVNQTQNAGSAGTAGTGTGNGGVNGSAGAAGGSAIFLKPVYAPG